MKSPIEKLLTVLGVPSEQRKSRYCCPLHSRDSFTLVFLKNNILPGGYRVKCSDPKCRFDGTVFDLMMMATSEPASAVMSMFLPEGELYDTFCPSSHNRSLDRAVVEDHINTLNLDKSVKDYLKGCKKEFLANSALRSSLTSYGVQESVLESLFVGKFDRVMPEQFDRDTPRVNKEDLLVCPYTCGGMVTGMVVMDPCTNLRIDVPISPEGENYGIFQEHVLSSCKSVYVCPDELTAILAYSKFLEFTNEPSSTICLKTPEALANVPEDRSVCLLSTPEKILQFHNAATYWMKHRHDRDLRVVELPRRMVNFGGLGLKSVLETSVPIGDWLVDHLAKVNFKKGPPEVTRVVSSVGFSKKDKAELMKLLKEAGHDDSLLLSAVRNAKLAGSMMKYGSQSFRRNSTSYADVSKGGNRKISNFVIYIDTITEDDKGNKIAIGRVRTDNDSDKLINVAIPTKDLVNPHGSKLTQIIWAQAKEQGINFLPWAGELHGGVTWFNILLGFDDPEFHRSVSDLGARGDGMLNLPRVRIDTTAKTLHPGGFLHNVDPVVAASYGEIILTKEGDGVALKALLESNNPVAIRLSLILGHMLHQTVCPVVLENKYVPKHLGIPYTVNSEVSYNALSQACCTLGGSPRPTLVSTQAADFNSIVKSNKQLETLPAIYVTRDPDNSRVLDWLYSSRNSMVLGVPAQVMTKLDRQDYIYFLYEDSDSVGFNYLLDTELLESTQSVWPFAIMSACEKVKPGIDLNPDVVPAIRGRQWLADEVGAKLPEVDCVIADYYSPITEHGLDMFLTVMSEQVHYGNALMAKNRREYRSEGDKYVGCVEGHYASFHSTRAIKFMADLGIPFTKKYLRNECGKRRYLRSRSQEDIPVFIEVWEEYMKPKRSKMLTKSDLRLVDAS